MTLDPLLAEMKTAAQTLRPDQSNDHALQRLWKAFEAIQTTSSLVGFEEVADFAGHVLDLFVQLRAEAVPVTYHLPSVLIAAADQIALLLSAAQGGPPVDTSLQAALLETIFQMTEPDLPPVPRTAKVPQPDREPSLQDAIVLRYAEQAPGL
jgi:chemotaxis protein histidine kinase CheA